MIPLPDFFLLMRHPTLGVVIFISPGNRQALQEEVGMDPDGARKKQTQIKSSFCISSKTPVGSPVTIFVFYTLYSLY